MAESKVSLKLLIHTHGERVLSAEASKDFVDFLFGILSLPVGTVISILGKQKKLGSLTNLYKSIENLNDSYIQPNQTKDSLLNPVHAVSGSSVSLLLNDAPTVRKSKSSPFSSHVSDPLRVCPNCGRNMTAGTPFGTSFVFGTTPSMFGTSPSFGPPCTEKQASGGEGGFVKGVITYMVTDDLVVTPVSTISCITLLNKFNVKKVSALQEKVVHLGKNEAMKLLNASLKSQKVLTDVFLNGI